MMVYRTLLLILAVVLTGCSDCTLCKYKPEIKFPCCVEGRRPPVMETVYDDIIDFDECDPGCEKEEKNEPPHFLPEFFDPYSIKEGEYRLVKGDILEIAVVGDQDTLVDSVEIAPDGQIYYLFLSGIHAEGRSISEVRKEIEDKLSHYFNNPVVAVIPKKISHQTYVILGRVKKPGVYTLSYPVRLRDAVSQAGGVYVETYNEISILPRGGTYFEGYSNTKRNFSNLHHAFLVRNGERLNIDFDKLIYQGDESQNIFLRAGDYVHISSVDHKNIFIVGAVKAPRAIRYTDGITLMGALTSAGGWTYGYPYSGDPSRVLIVRGSLNCPRAIHVDLIKLLKGQARDVVLCPGDIVYVQNKSLRFGRELIKIAIDSYLQAFGITAAGDLGNNHWFHVPGLTNTTTGE